jgi:hypothetical protein
VLFFLGERFPIYLQQHLERVHHSHIVMPLSPGRHSERIKAKLEANATKYGSSLCIPSSLEKLLQNNKLNIPSPPRAEITKTLSNNNPKLIDDFGFVELCGALPPLLLRQIKEYAINQIKNWDSFGQESTTLISNSLQVDLSNDLLGEIKNSLRQKKTIIEETMKFVYDKTEDAETKIEIPSYKGYSVETPKILVTIPGSAPQLPHADDHCSSCIICLLHLGDDQESTRIAPYGKKKDYPTGVTITCQSEYSLLCFYTYFGLVGDGWMDL